MAGRFMDIEYDLKKLPTVPTVVAEVIKLINSPTSSAHQLAGVVAKDPVASAQVLKIANSTFYSMSRQVNTLPMAIVVLGERVLKSLVLAASMRSMYQTFGTVERILWEDSMICALGSRFLAQKLALVDPEEAFMAGMFRHIGKIIINNQEGRKDPAIAQLMISESADATDQEKKLLGSTHAEIGAAVLERWHLSELLSFVALQHAQVNLDGIDDPDTRNMICLVNVAGQFPGLLGEAGKQLEQIPDTAGARYLQLDSDSLKTFLEEFRIVFQENREEFLS